MRKLHSSNVITGCQPILCSHYTACAQEIDQTIIIIEDEKKKIKCH